jgi:hypothetical protein
MPNDPERDDQLPPAEAARARRRDRDASAAERKGMRTGLAKQFKQVLDAQAERAREVDRPAGPRRPPERPEPPKPGQPGKAPG